MVVRQQQREVISEPQPGPQPQILPPQQQQQQVQPALLPEGGPEGGAGTDARSRLRTPRLPRTDNGISSGSSSSSSGSSSSGIQPTRGRTEAISAEATAAAITAVRHAEAQAQGRDSAQGTITTATAAGVSTIAKGPSKADTVTKVTFLKGAATPTITMTATEDSRKKDRKGYNSSIDPLLTLIKDFLGAIFLLVGVIATAWFLVACMALNPDSAFWRRRRARRRGGSRDASIGSSNGSSSACADVAVFVLAGLFCVAVVVLGRYVAVVWAWVGGSW